MLTSRRPFRTLAPILAIVTLAMAMSIGCKRGEKSCKYYSIVIAKSENPEQRRQAVEALKRMGDRDRQKCKDPKVFERLLASIDEAEGKKLSETSKTPVRQLDAALRTLLMDALENVGRGDDELKTMSEPILVRALEFDDIAPVVAEVIRTWRLEGKDSGKLSGWVPQGPRIPTALQAAIDKATRPGTRGPLLDALFLVTPDEKAQHAYEDLLLKLAVEDPNKQGVEVNARAVAMLGILKVDKAIPAIIKALFLRDAGKAEVYMPARNALTAIGGPKVAEAVLKVFMDKDPEFAEWTKKVGLFEWEWKEGPKLVQVLRDLRDRKSAMSLVESIGKAIDASRAPQTFSTMRKDLTWEGYIDSRWQITTFAIASMDDGLNGPVADKIAEVMATRGLIAQQRTLPAVGLAISGAKDGWAALVKGFKATDGRERADMVTALSFAVGADNLADWDAVLAKDKTEGVVIALKDSAVEARLKVVQDCKKEANCYVQRLETGDALAKEKSAIMLMHGYAPADTLLPKVVEAFDKSQPSDMTLRQILIVALGKLAGASKDLPKARQSIELLGQMERAKAGNDFWLAELQAIINYLRAKERGV